MDEMARRWQAQRAAPPPEEKVCRGTLLAMEQFKIDVEHWGYQDGRVLYRAEKNGPIVQEGL